MIKNGTLLFTRSPAIFIIEEPFGGAHRDPAIAIRNLGNALEVTLAEYQDPTQYHQYSQKRLERYKHLHIA